MTTEPMTTTHDLTLDPRRPGAPFSGSCSCGRRIEGATTAGMVHGWHGTHVDEAALCTHDAGTIQHRRSGYLNDGPAGEVLDLCPDCGAEVRRPAFVPASALRPGDEILDVDEWGNPTSVVVRDVTTVGRRTVLRLDSGAALSVPASRTYEVER